MYNSHQKGSADSKNLLLELIMDEVPRQAIKSLLKSLHPKLQSFSSRQSIIVHPSISPQNPEDIPAAPQYLSSSSLSTASALPARCVKAQKNS